MRASTPTLAAALAVCRLGPAFATPHYAGPRFVTSETRGPLAPGQNRTVDLVRGQASFEAPCETAGTCDNHDRRHIIIPTGRLATLRALATATRDRGLLDHACVARREKQAEAGHRRQAGSRPDLPLLPPDPVWSSLTVVGLGTMTYGPDVDSFRTEVNCASEQARALWHAIDAL